MIDAYAFMTFTSMVDETWNCANPRPYPKEKYKVCQWSESDLKLYKGTWILKPKDADDNLKSASKLAGSLAALNQSAKGSAKVTARLQQVQAIINTYAAMNAAVAPPPSP